MIPLVLPLLRSSFLYSTLPLTSSYPAAAAAAAEIAAAAVAAIGARGMEGWTMAGWDGARLRDGDGRRCSHLVVGEATRAALERHDNNLPEPAVFLQCPRQRKRFKDELGLLVDLGMVVGRMRVQPVSPQDIQRLDTDKASPLFACRTGNPSLDVGLCASAPSCTVGCGVHTGCDPPRSRLKQDCARIR